jgi:hypothetical protein
MKKHAWFALVGLFLVALVSLFGCSTTTTTTNSNTPATPPSGTTQVKLSGGNVSINGTTLSFALTVLDQSNNPIGSQYFTAGNLTGGIYTSLANATGGSSEVATVTISTLTGGSASTAKKVSAALVLDSTGSMSGAKLATMEAAAKAFLAAATSANNRAGLITITSAVNTIAPMQTLTSANVTAMNALIDAFSATGGTKLYDAMGVGIDMASAEASATDLVRAAVVMSDGGEGGSTILLSTGEVITKAQTANIPVYTVGLYVDTWEAASYGPPMKAVAAATTGSDAGYFEIIAGATGTGSLVDLYNKLAAALSQSYTTTATLSTALTAGQTYVMKIALLSYGTFTGQTLYITFTVI